MLDFECSLHADYYRSWKSVCPCRYLGLFANEVDAALAYDRESVVRKGLKAVTNFDICQYLDLLSEPSICLSPFCPSASHQWSTWTQWLKTWCNCLLWSNLLAGKGSKLTTAKLINTIVYLNGQDSQKCVWDSQSLCYTKVWHTDAECMTYFHMRVCQHICAKMLFSPHDTFCMWMGNKHAFDFNSFPSNSNNP